MDEQPRPDADKLAGQLRASLRQRRRRPPPWLLLILLVFVPVAALAWWFRPRFDVPRLCVVGLDQAALPEETVAIRARLTPVDAGVTVPSLAGLDVSFEALPGTARVESRSNSEGDVSVSWKSPAVEGPIDFRVAFVPSHQRYRSEDVARLFAWKAGTRLLLVEVSALADADPDAWRTRHASDIAVRAAANQLLQPALDKHFQAVYLAAGASSPLVYRKMRGWVETRTQQERAFPDGPVLGVMAGGNEEAKAWANTVADLKRRYAGHMTGVARDGELRKVFRDAGVEE
jgi:hypothetical protein